MFLCKLLTAQLTLSLEPRFLLQFSSFQMFTISLKDVEHSQHVYPELLDTAVVHDFFLFP